MNTNELIKTRKIKDAYCVISKYDLLNLLDKVKDAKEDYCIILTGKAIQWKDDKNNIQFSIRGHKPINKEVA